MVVPTEGGGRAPTRRIETADDLIELRGVHVRGIEDRDDRHY